jgi:hypothetical protein
LDVSKYLHATAKKIATKPSKGIFRQIVDNINIQTEYKDILLEYPEICLQHGPKIKQYILDYKAAHKPSFRNWAMNVSYLYGNTGTGKSQSIFDDYHPDTHYICSRPQNGSIWFDGYTGQDTIIIDDFCHSDYQHMYMLNLLDRYPMQLPIKGGMTQMLAKNIVITSNHSPDTLYRGVPEEHRKAFHRRITTYKQYISPDVINIYHDISQIENTILDTEEDTDEDNEIIKNPLPIISKKTTVKNIDKPLSYRCHICDERFRNEQYLKIHSRIHNNYIPVEPEHIDDNILANYCECNDAPARQAIAPL